MTTTPEPSGGARLRRGILHSIDPGSAAWSVNGRDVTFMAGFDFGVEPGGFAAAVTDAGRRVVFQVHELRLAVRDGVRVDLDTAAFADASTAGAVRSATVGLAVRFVEGTGLVIGGVGTDPFAEADLVAATDAEVAAALAGQLGSSAGLALGRLKGSSVDATLKASGFARHTFLCGQSGSGKTYTLGALLERMVMATDLPMVIIDPNSDYVGLGRMRSRDELDRTRDTPIGRSRYAALKAEYTERAAGVRVASSGGADLPLRINLSDLTLDEQALTLELDPTRDADDYAAYADATLAVGSDRYGFDEVIEVLRGRFDEASRRVAQRIQNMRVADWAVWARAGESSLAELGVGHRVLVIDTGSLADARERSVVALALLGRLRRGGVKYPMSIVIDEAHNVCSPDAISVLERAVAEHVIWIAAEGRKYGRYLVLSTQRPQKVHRNVLSQCDNLLLMRVNSVTDLSDLASVFSHVPAPMIAEAKSFAMGEMLAAGPIAATPLRLRTGERWSPEGGADLPTTWAARRDDR